MWHPVPDPTGPHPAGKGLGLYLVNQSSPTFPTSQLSWIRMLILRCTGAALRPQDGHRDLLKALAEMCVGGWVVGDLKEVTMKSGLA